MHVCIAGFRKGQLKILAHSYDRSPGGRDFDEALFKYFAVKFKEEYKIDVYQNARACMRLRTACEKLKKMPRANLEAPLNIECLMDEKDVRGYIKRGDFELISVPILERVKVPLENALQEAHLTVDNIHSIEVVGSGGSGSRVPAIIKILTEYFVKEPRHTFNASECVARGCALQCVVLSPAFKVHESFPFSIAMSWKGPSNDSENGALDHQHSAINWEKLHNESTAENTPEKHQRKTKAQVCKNYKLSLFGTREVFSYIKRNSKDAYLHKKLTSAVIALLSRF
ncbi:Heat shock 70 kDa protein 14 [Platanthera guangdongensis]|uniref:Heat shock 70 kDa protein 14 n=1 Tax=Platanthera guangdongensis TaxID=2320717 RepID=A0ABR2LX38_9ASPA